MTESHVLARTGLSLRTHQHLTVVDYLRLRDLDPELPFIPVLQGQSITDYHRCADMYEQRGVDLAELPLVGVGSVCRRQHTIDVERIVRSLAARGYRPPRLRRESARSGPVHRRDHLQRLCRLELPRAVCSRVHIQPPQRIQLSALRSGLAYKALDSAARDVRPRQR